MTESMTCSYFMCYNPKAKAWSEINRIKSPMGNLQTQIVQLTGHCLVAYYSAGRQSTAWRHYTYQNPKK